MRYLTRAEVERIGQAGSAYNLTAGPWPAYRYLASYWLFVEPSDLAFTPHAPSGFWEAWITCWLSQQFDGAELFIDVGANVGYYTLMAAKHGLKTIAFEPNSAVCDMLRASVWLNREGPRVNVINMALSDTQGETNLVVPSQHSGGAFITDSGPGIRVETTRLDKCSVGGHKTVLVKIDAEGAEPRIWAGMDGLLRSRSRVTTVLEWDGSRWPNGGKEKFAYELFKQPFVGYVLEDGTEQVFTGPQQLEALKGLHMVIVRNFI